MSTLKQKINKIFRPNKGEHEPDKVLIVIIFILLIFGLVSLTSATGAVAYTKFGNAYYYVRNQLLGLGIGLFAFWFLSRIDYHKWKKYAFIFLIFSIILLLLVFIPGLSATYGKARSWINIFGYSLQPSEFVKLSFLLYLAAWLERRKGQLQEISQGIGPFLAVLGIIAFLMVLQPDIGTLSIIGITSLTVYFIGGGKIMHIAVILLFTILSFAVMVQMNTYQLNRFRCMLNPSYDPAKTCYQTNQSLIAVGSGGIFGRGLGNSQSKFMYLPEVSGDSIFAIIAEETGLIISSLLILCYAFLFYRGFLIARHSPDDFGRILAIGIVSWLVIQAFINIGGIINFMPMTGVPLPLISYGGSAILAALAALGILVNISKQTKAAGR